MNKQILTFYIKKSNGVIAQVGHGYIWQQAQKKQNNGVSVNMDFRETEEVID